jgi:hypothetical protein
MLDAEVDALLDVSEVANGFVDNDADGGCKTLCVHCRSGPVLAQPTEHNPTGLFRSLKCRHLIDRLNAAEDMAEAALQPLVPRL